MGRYLDLSSCRLATSPLFPTSLSMLTALQYLDLGINYEFDSTGSSYENAINAPIPTWITTLTALTYVFLANDVVPLATCRGKVSLDVGVIGDTWLCAGCMSGISTLTPLASPPFHLPLEA